MAGIGFRLQKLLSGESYSDIFRAYLYSAIIATGPLLVVMISLVAAKTVLQTRLGVEDGQLFLSLIVYVYGFSMVGISPLFYTVTRHLADNYYAKKLEIFTPTYLAVLEMTFLFESVTGIIFLHFIPITFTLKWLTLSLYLVVGSLWLSMIFLSAARNYLWIVVAFVAGGAIGVAASIFWGRHSGLVGFIGGYMIGQWVTFVILTVRIFREFGFARTHDFTFLRTFQKYPLLALVGVFYYSALWVDKLIFWFSSGGITVIGPIRIFPDYDTPTFIAFLTIVPAMAFFLAQMETSFVRVYRGYYDSIRNRDDLATIRGHKKSIVNNLTQHFVKFVLFQGTISGLAILFIYNIADAFALNPSQMGILRISILAVFCQMGFIMVLNVLFYFDCRREACLLAFIYLATNTAFTLISLKVGLPAYGFGFAVSCFVTLVSGFIILDQRLKNLEYWTFMRQPVLVPKFRLESETG